MSFLNLNNKPIWLIVLLMGMILGLSSAMVLSFSRTPPTPADIVKKAPEGTMSATFPEGSSIYKMGEILNAGGYLSSEAFQEYAYQEAEPEWMVKYPYLAQIPIKSLEGYLYPDTYIFSRYMSARRLALVMIRRFDEVVIPFWATAQSDTKLSLHQIVTLASIIEKEAEKPEERPIIASVYLNRLRIGMKLDADPTVKYALEDPHKKVYLNDLKVKSPYNTYQNKGLPPTPISNPTRESINAVLHPQASDYLYYLHDMEGKIHYGRTLEEHNANKAQYL